LNLNYKPTDFGHLFAQEHTQYDKLGIAKNRQPLKHLSNYRLRFQPFYKSNQQRRKWQHSLCCPSKRI
jgi:hypothetical protein